MNVADVPSFCEWYAAVNDDRSPEHRDPFPWQARLAATVEAGSDWPDTIKVPTGLGKTACLDIAAWALAAQAGRPPEERTARTRIWWVVNRRLLVDDTYRHAQKLQQMLRDAHPCSVVGRVSTALRNLAGSEDAEPLEVCRLRGGEPPQRPRLASQPAIICSTIPMYGSRLLFRGYGSSKSMWPIDAALAGTDSLVLLDEAHLANGLRHLICRVNSIQRTASGLVGCRPLSILPVAITATADAGTGTVFDIDADDEKNETVRKRLAAAKRLSLYAGKSWDKKPTAGTSHEDAPLAEDAENFEVSNIGKDVAAATKALLQTLDVPADAQQRTVLVFVNSPRTAAEVHSTLDAQLPACETLIITGQTRGREATWITEKIRSWMTSDCGPPEASNDAEPPTRVVVATQTLEVGADLDADHMITESCGVQALIQRLGRLNRMGHRNDSQVCYVHDPKSSERPLYGTAPGEIWERFKRSALPGTSSGRGILQTSLDLSPRLLRDPGGPLPQAPPPADATGYPVLHDGVLRELTQTSCPVQNETPVAVFFEGTQEPNREIDLVWRAYVPDSRLRWDGEDERLWPPLSADEVISAPIWTARRALQNLSPADRNRLFCVEPDWTLSRAAWRDDNPVVKPGQTLILPASAGMLSQHGMLDIDSTALVVDAAIASAEHGLPLDKGAIRHLCGHQAQRPLPPDVAAALAGMDFLFEPDGLDDYSDADIDEACEALFSALHELVSVDGPHDTDTTTEAPQAFRRRQNLAGAIRGLLDGDASRNWTRETPATGASRVVPNTPRRARGNDRLDEHDDFSVGLPENETLQQHSNKTADMTKHVATQIGLRPGLADLVRLAAVSHDAGKADDRFQRWLGEGERPPDVLGKSSTPHHKWSTYRSRAGWPRGGRHEELSRRLVQSYLKERPSNDGLEDLLLHLVVSHHGHGRPLLLGVANDEHSARSVEWSIEGVGCKADATLSSTDWDQPSRFHTLCDVWGYWGLALLEAILRQSDHFVS